MAFSVSACGPHAVTPPAPPAHDSGHRGCELLANNQLEVSTDLLDGRLRIRLPGGARGPGPDPPDTCIQRFAFEGINIDVQEGFIAIPPGFTANELEESIGLPSSLAPEARPFGGAAGVRGIEVVASRLPTEAASAQAVPVAEALVVHSDGTVLKLTISMRREWIQNDLGPCTSFATRILQTLEIGPRKLDLAAGVRRAPGITQGEEVVLDVPAGFAVAYGAPTSLSITALSVYKVAPLGQVGPDDAPRLRVVGWPAKPADGSPPITSRAETSLFGDQLGSTACVAYPRGFGLQPTWMYATYAGAGGRKGEVSLEIFALDRQSCEELRQVAQTLRVAQSR